MSIVGKILCTILVIVGINLIASLITFALLKEHALIYLIVSTILYVLFVLTMVLITIWRA